MTEKPIILVDLDGPMADFDLAFYNLCRDRGYAMHRGQVHNDNRCFKHRFATDCITDPDEKVAARSHVDTSDWFRHLPPTEGAIEGIQELLAHPGVDDVFFCTKPMEANATCRDDKAQWVEEHLGVDWVRRLIVTPDKGMIRGSILLDDAPKAQWFDRAEWRPVIFPMSWNAPGSKFSQKMTVCNAPRWTWGDPVEDLLAAVPERILL